MKIGIVSRTDRKEALQLTEKIITLLRTHEIFVDPSMVEYFDLDVIDDVDIIIVIGGDGTILRSVRKYKEIPILPVNMGTHGYLTEIKPENYKKILEILKDHKIEERTKLKIIRNGNVIGEVLNEITIRSEEPGKVANFLLRYDDKEEIIRGDGVIVATPTGSTAHSLSAGGPILHIDLSAVVITPLVSLNRQNFPTVIPDNLEISIKNIGKNAYLIFDGENRGILELNEKIKIKKSKNKAHFVRM